MRDPAEGVSPDGLIVTEARRERVPHAFESVLTAASEEFGAMAENASLYLYGSVATGTARVPSSDVDFLTVGLATARAIALGSSMSDRFGTLCRGVAFAPFQLKDFFGEHDAAYGNRVFLRSYCVHLSGPDRQAGLPEFPADARAARGFNGDIAVHLRRWRDLVNDPDLSYTLLARRVARKTLFAVAGLVSVRDSTWTTDGVGAARRWSDVEPALAGSLATLAAWSQGTVQASHSELQAVLAPGAAVECVTRAFEDSIGLWDS